MSEYLPTIGLEIHAELNTRTKMFCDSKNDASEKRPNTNVCPVCMAHPGTLPTINRAAVEHCLRVGAALGANLADYTEFDRKNYFYPDLPKGYQLSQFEYPLVSGGALNGIKITRVHLEEDTASSVHDENSNTTLIDYNRAGVPLMELVTEPVIHNAEDAGNFGRELQLLLRYLGASEADMEKGQMRLEANISVAKISNSPETQSNNADEPSFRASSDVSRDNSSSTSSNKSSDDSSETFSDSNDTSSRSNSSGTDEVNIIEKSATSSSSSGGAEIPENTNPSYAGMASSSDNKAAGHDESKSSQMQISEAPIDLSKLGTKVEVKNINSFRAMERAIQYEVKRQIALLEKGEKVVQETRGWDENKQATFSQRVKEGSADYRYFPDPDLPSLKLSELGLTIETIRETLPELPTERRERYRALNINTQDVELYVKDSLFGAFFEAVVKELGEKPDEIKLASNYIANDLVKLIADIRDTDTRGMKSLDKMPISASNFAKLIRLISSKKVSSRSAKELLALCLDGTSDPEVLAKDKGLLQDVASSQIVPVVQKIITDNQSVVADYLAGKDAALQFLIGQGMKALKGAADPSTLRAELIEEITKTSK